MTTSGYTCTSCDLGFERLGQFAAHIQQEHDPTGREDEFELKRRNAQIEDDDDDEGDDDNGEDELLPTDPGAVAELMELLGRRACVQIAERNHPALETVRAELESIEAHARITAEAMLRAAEKAHGTLRTVEWVLREDAPVIS